MDKVIHDKIWKDAIEEFTQEFLLFFAPDMSEYIDFSKGFEFLDKELDEIMLGSEGHDRRCDKLIKVYFKDGNDRWILAHVEVQGYKDEDFAERMYQYYYRIRDRYQKKIFALGVFTESNADYRPEKYEDDFFDTKTTYSYRTYKILEQDEKVLAASENPFSIVVLAALYALKSKTNQKLRYSFRKNLNRILLERKWDKNKRRKLLIYINFVLQVNDKEKQLTLKNEALKIFEEDDDTMALNIFDTDIFEEDMKEIKKRVEKETRVQIEKETRVQVEKETQERVKETRVQVEKETTQRVEKETLLNTITTLIIMKLKLASISDVLYKKMYETDKVKLNRIRDSIFDINSIDEVEQLLC
jgi:hypothetical protein